MSPSQAIQYIVEENVKKQVESIVEMKVIEDVWKHELEGKGRKLRIHGWVYELSTGLLKDLNITREPLGH
jgi:carbonic anhydrase